MKRITFCHIYANKTYEYACTCLPLNSWGTTKDGFSCHFFFQILKLKVFCFVVVVLDLLHDKEVIFSLP